MNAYWSDSPPLHLLVAGYLGIKPKTSAPEGLPPESAEVLGGGKPKPAPKFMTADEYLALKEKNAKQ